MKLIDSKTGEQMQRDARVQTFRGEKAILLGWKPPHRPGSTGRVYVEFVEDMARLHEFFPSVIGCKFVDDEQGG
jgi:hypothetical protein